MGASISRYGATAAGAAVLTILASAYLAFTGVRCPPLLLVFFYGAGASEIIVLCRMTVPGWLQGLLVLLIIMSLTTLTARTDLFGIHHTSAMLPEAAAADIEVPRAAARLAGPGGGAGASAGGGGGGSQGGSSGYSGAKVVFSPALGGDGGWAGRLNAAYDRQLGGPQAAGLMVIGDVGAKKIGGDTNLEVRWGVSIDGDSVRCGSTSAYGSDGSALAEQISQALGQAISRSLALQRASCQ